MSGRGTYHRSGVRSCCPYCYKHSTTMRLSRERAAQEARPANPRRFSALSDQGAQVMLFGEPPKGVLVPLNLTSIECNIPSFKLIGTVKLNP